MRLYNPSKTEKFIDVKMTKEDARASERAVVMSYKEQARKIAKSMSKRRCDN